MLEKSKKWREIPEICQNINAVMLLKKQDNWKESLQQKKQNKTKRRAAQRQWSFSSKGLKKFFFNLDFNIRWKYI